MIYWETKDWSFTPSQKLFQNVWPMLYHLATLQNTRQTHNVVTTLPWDPNVLQPIHHVLMTLISQYQNYSVASSLDSKFNSRCTLNVVLAMVLQLWNRDVKFTTHNKSGNEPILEYNADHINSFKGIVDLENEIVHELLDVEGETCSDVTSNY